MTAHTYKTWWLVKGKITSRFGSVTACALKLRSSTDSIRKAVEGRCPGVAERLKVAIAFDWEDAEQLKAARSQAQLTEVAA